MSLMLPLVACGGGNTEESSVDASSEESIDLGFVPNPNVDKIKGYLGNEINRDQLATNVFLNREYTASRAASSTYPDPNFKLTNGEYSDVIYSNFSFVGWEGSSTVSVMFDLGEEQHDIADISVGCGRILDYNIGLPRSVSVKASNDGKKFTEISSLNTPTDLARNIKYTYYFAFPKALNARYILISFNQPERAMICVDEIMAFEYSEQGTITTAMNDKPNFKASIRDFYNYDLNLGESDVKVSESDADYNQLRNLATIEGVEFQISHFDALITGHSNSGMDKIGMLTDGKYHGKDLDDDYFVFYRGSGRHVVTDLGQIMSVSGMNIYYADKYTWGISTPPAYYISVSENGTDWVTVFDKANPDYGKVEHLYDDHKCDFGKAYRARYVRLTFPTVPDNTISCAVHIDEIEIMGKKNPAGAVTATDDGTHEYGVYPSPEKYGMSDILFTGITDEYGVHCTEYNLLTEQTAIEYLAVLDENGKATEQFMDSFAFTTRHPINSYAERDKGFSFFLDELFYEGINMDAVEAAKKKINEDLGISGKCKVWISVNCPIIGDTFMGEKIETEEDYIACLKWQVDESIKRFNAKNYQYVELAGFYWQSETMRPHREYAPEPAHDFAAAKAHNDYLHSMGYLSLWCPYYNCVGLYANKFLGFDITCWQPNLMWYWTEETRITTAAELAKLYGVGIEIEIEHSAQSEQTLKLYRDYIGTGVDYGFINSINAYYQGAVPGAYTAYRNDGDPLHQKIWEETLMYVNDTLDRNYNTLTEPKDLSGFNDAEITVQSGRTRSCEIGKLSGYTYRVSQSPLFGKLTLNEDGTLKYSAMDGYAGEDTICVTVYDGISEFKTFTIKVTVTE